MPLREEIPDPDEKVTLRESLRLDMIENAESFGRDPTSQEDLDELELAINQLTVTVPDLDFDEERKTRAEWRTHLFPSRVVPLPTITIPEEN